MYVQIVRYFRANLKIFVIYIRFVPAAVDRHDSCRIHRLHWAEVVFAGLDAEALHVGVACPLQRETHGDEDGIFFVGFVRDQARAFDSVARGGGGIEEGAQVDCRSQEVHSLAKGAACEGVHGAHQQPACIALDLVVENVWGVKYFQGLYENM